MAIGLKIYNADGSLQFDMGNRLFRLLTVQDIGSTNSGSVTVNPQGTLDVIALPKNASTTSGEPTVTISGGTVSWNYGGAPTRRPYELTLLEF